MTLDWSRAVVLSTTEFEVCWELLGLDETPWQLDPARSGITAPERQAIVAGVIAGMQRRALGDSRGPGPAIADQLRLLAHPEWALDVRFRMDGLVAGLAACRGSRCAFAVRHSGEIALLTLPADAATASLSELLGTMPPGRGREVRVPAAALDGARAVAPQDHDRFTDELVLRGLDSADAVAFTNMCRGVDMRGQLGASATGGDGTRVRRAPYVVGFHRTAAGAFRQVRHRIPGGDIVTVGPTSKARMLADLGELVGSLR